MPSTLKAIHEFHKDYGIFKWNDLVNIVKELSEKGFRPPNRLKGALKKEKYLFDIEPKSLFNQIKNNPEKTLLITNIRKHLKKYKMIFQNFTAEKSLVTLYQKLKNPLIKGFYLLKILKKLKLIKIKRYVKKPKMNTIFVDQIFRLQEQFALFKLY